MEKITTQIKYTQFLEINTNLEKTSLLKVG